MVTLQILVLPFLVRVRVPQHKEIRKSLNRALADFFYSYSCVIPVFNSCSTRFVSSTNCSMLSCSGRSVMNG